MVLITDLHGRDLRLRKLAFEKSIDVGLRGTCKLGQEPTKWRRLLLIIVVLGISKDRLDKIVLIAIGHDHPSFPIATTRSKG